jgi:uncharacterized membrane protein YadS
MSPARRAGSGSGLGDLLTIGVAAGGCLATGVGVGYWIGTATGTDTLSTLIGVAVGICGAIAVTYTIIKRSI